jgi:pentose-5-phosphate-3-epimerase
MARRGNNLFKRNDGLRAVRIARDGGIEPAMIEIVANDGTTFRVYGENLGAPSAAGAKAWDEAIAKLQAKPKTGRSRSAPTRRS